MSELVKLKKKIEIKKFLDEMGVKYYKIKEDFTVDVDGTVWLYVMEKIPIQFGKVRGDFLCSGCGLKSLKGCPHTVGGSFDCEENMLTSLEYCPKVVGNNFFCGGNIVELKRPKGLKFGGSFFSSQPSPF